VRSLAGQYTTPQLAAEAVSKASFGVHTRGLVIWFFDYFLLKMNRSHTHFFW
jgi:hypothetical protein